MNSKNKKSLKYILYNCEYKFFYCDDSTLKNKNVIKLKIQLTDKAVQI